ncbi:Beta-lactamase-like protein-like protein 2 [Seiridium cupressi]
MVACGWSCFALVATFALQHATAKHYCPPAGPVLPAARAPSTHKVVQEGVADLLRALETYSGYLPHTAMSVSAKSLHETKPFASIQITPSGGLNTSGTVDITDETVYRVSSISKIFPVYALLQLSVNFEVPITTYVPRLKDIETDDPTSPIATVDWDHVTIGSLASHLSGISAEFGVDLAGRPGPPFPGFPVLAGPSKPACAITGFELEALQACTSEDFLRDFGVRHPVFAPYTTAVYSNVGIFLLSQVVEAVSKVPYESYIRENILAPLGMTNTTISKPPSHTSWGAIPHNHTAWGLDLGFENAAGGVYSNTKDLIAFGDSILSSKLLHPTTTNRWLKPAGFTPSAGVLVGHGWEILRTKNLTGDERITPAFYKSGHLPGYQAALILVPDYDLVLTILLAGPADEADEALEFYYRSRFIQRMVPILDQAAKDEASAKYSGTYVDDETDSRLVLGIDDGPGLSVKEYVVRGVNMMFGPQGNPASIRYYPSNLHTPTHEAWRSVTVTKTADELSQQDASLIWDQSSCPTFGTLDRLGYGYKALDEIIFKVDELSGTSSEIELRALQVTLKKVGNDKTSAKGSLGSVEELIALCQQLNTIGLV